MESLLAEFLPDLLILFPPCRDYSFVLKLLIHPPDSDCSLHPLSYSAGSLASRGLHSSGRNRKWWCSQCQDWGWGQSALKAWEKPATPLQAGQSLERSERSNGTWRIDFTVWRGPKAMFWTEKRAFAGPQRTEGPWPIRESTEIKSGCMF